MSTVKFNFSKELKADLAKNGKQFDDLLFKACLEGKEAGVKATDFCAALRASGFRCGTGPARAAYKAVRDGKTQKVMVAAITAVKAKRKASKGKGKTDAGKGKDGATAGTDKGTDTTLVGALEAATHAAQAGNLEVAETWILKAQAILEASKLATAQAIKKMGGVA